MWLFFSYIILWAKSLFFFFGFFLFFLNLFIYLFVVNFVIHWNKTAMGLHVFPCEFRVTLLLSGPGSDLHLNTGPHSWADFQACCASLRCWWFCCIVYSSQVLTLRPWWMLFSQSPKSSSFEAGMTLHVGL